MRAVALLACLPAVLAGCSRDAADDGDPGTFRVAKAVLKSLLSSAAEPSSAEPSSEEVDAAEPSKVVSESAPAAASAQVAPEPEAPQTCVVPYSGPVTIIAAASTNVLRKSVLERRGVPLVYETDDTAIWEDGRVMTVDVENVGNHLNAVGWATNPMQILGAGTRPGGSSAGWDSGDGQFAFKQSKARKTRRRG